jgi:UDP-N-acetylglucosamine 3-dehydrogenase
MKIAVIGTGSMGKNHVRVLKNISEVSEILIADIDSSNLTQTAEIYGIKKKYKNYIDLLENENPDGVIIATLPNTHKEIAVKILDLKIPVLVEKPIAHSVDDAEEMIKVSLRNKTILTVGHTERFNPVITKINEFIDSGLLTNIYLINSHRVGPFPKRLLGNVEGVLIDLAVHDFDIINYIGGAILSMKSQIINLGKQEIYVKTLLDVKNDIKASCEFSWVTPRRHRIIEIYGDSGMYLGDYFNQELRFFENSDYNRNSKSTSSFMNLGMINAGKEIKYPIFKQEPLLLEVKNFIDAIVNSTSPLVSPEDAKLALERALEL